MIKKLLQKKESDNTKKSIQDIDNLTSELLKKNDELLKAFNESVKTA